MPKCEQCKYLEIQDGLSIGLCKAPWAKPYMAIFVRKNDYCKSFERKDNNELKEEGEE